MVETVTVIVTYQCILDCNVALHSDCSTSGMMWQPITVAAGKLLISCWMESLAMIFTFQIGCMPSHQLVQCKWLIADTIWYDSEYQRATRRPPNGQCSKI